MALSIKNDEADRLARELAEETGDSITDAIVIALRERLERVRSKPGKGVKLRALIGEVSSYPVIDERRADDIVGYGEHGLP